ncbi:HNH endonuclease [Clostridium sp. LY3-2]|uniref:HNH endonuclease n=1 Tax=Clostridium sp. LY3-2 TaxID=2942482 RepID=UPI0021520A01|nr:HNH endonuclease [Clostridium sp. LY3-2]MCR6516445.1 HNH endonuclease [Clostridium sp. LY3-2]
MNYFIVFQRKFKDELNLGCLWAPKKQKGGKDACFHWKNMIKIKKGDIIFSINNRKIVSVNTAINDTYNAQRPNGLNGNWNDEGWRVDVKYNILNKTINVNDFIDSILIYCPEKHSPFNKNGNGAQGYLFDISEEFGNYIINIVSKENNLDSYLGNMSNEDTKYIEDVESELPENISETDRQALIKTRVGQGKFRDKLLERSSCCELCGIDIKEMLVASHCKPWSESNDFERLDSNNGLLLCANHDKLFDKGFISFDDNGKIIIKSWINDNQMKLLKISEEDSITIDKNQIKYIRYHRSKFK